MLLLIATVLTTTPSRAVERQHHIGLGPAFGALYIREKSTASIGAGAAFHYSYGLTDQFNLGLEASSVIVAAEQRQDTPESPTNRPATVDHAALGLGYVLDILRWVPYGTITAGAYRIAGGTLPSAVVSPGVSIGLGLDYQFTRHFAMGVAGRQHLIVMKLDDYPSYTTLLLRTEWMWGY
jgi:hypothetical protein